MWRKNNLSIVLFVLFALLLGGHAVSGWLAHNSEQRQHGSIGEVTVFSYLQTPQFWYESFQNWQSEFLAVLAIVVLSVRLRQWGSPESKPVHAPHSETGGA